MERMRIWIGFENEACADEVLRCTGWRLFFFAKSLNDGVTRWVAQAGPFAALKLRHGFGIWWQWPDRDLWNLWRERSRTWPLTH